MALKEIVLVFFLGGLVTCEPNDKVAISATILKCRRYGEKLTIPENGTDGTLRCVPSNAVTLTQKSSMKPVILLDTGHAILRPVGTGERFEHGEYCADAQGLLVCALGKIEANRAAATMRAKVYRCSGNGAAYHEDG